MVTNLYQLSRDPPSRPNTERTVDGVSRTERESLTPSVSSTEANSCVAGTKPAQYSNAEGVADLKALVSQQQEELGVLQAKSQRQQSDIAEMRSVLFSFMGRVEARGIDTVGGRVMFPSQTVQRPGFVGREGSPGLSFDSVHRNATIIDTHQIALPSSPGFFGPEDQAGLPLGDVDQNATTIGTHRTAPPSSSSFVDRGNCPGLPIDGVHQKRTSEPASNQSDSATQRQEERHR